MNVVHIYRSPEENPNRPEAPPPEKLIHIKSGATFVRIPEGCKSGKSSVAIMATTDDAKEVFIEITMNNFEAVAAAFHGWEMAHKARN